MFEARFMMGSLSIHMFSTGQLSERRKWIHSFENATSIVFCVDLACYDQVLFEISNGNKMLESLLIFDSVVNSRWFMRTSIVLLLCNLGLFRQKLGRSPLSKYFPDYSGGNDVNSALKYILRRFNQVNRACLNMYPHVTDNYQDVSIIVFSAVKETILQNALRDSGILDAHSTPLSSGNVPLEDEVSDHGENENEEHREEKGEGEAASDIGVAL
jgi:guanine nucleotide-binding protein subunit alpha